MANCKNDFLGTLKVTLTSFEWKESSPRRSAPKISHTGILPRGGLVLSLEYTRPLFVKTKNLFLKFLKPSLLLPWALFTNILQEKTRIFYTKYVFTITDGYFTCWLVNESFDHGNDILMTVHSVVPHSIETMSKLTLYLPKMRPI